MLFSVLGIQTHNLTVKLFVKGFGRLVVIHSVDEVTHNNMHLYVMFVCLLSPSEHISDSSLYRIRSLL
jgi:hypothetical protein